MRNIIVRIWKGDAEWARWIFYIPLSVLSHIYGVILLLRELLYRKGMIKVAEAPIPVISIGNITLGGTGKTPVVEKLTAVLKEKGFRPAIVTRGYKRKRKGTFPVDVQKDTAEDVGDEALMLARKTQLPVIVGTNRAQAIAEGIKTFQIDLAVLDDGFQLRNIKKDVDILVLKGNYKGESHALFPLGPNREPRIRIKEADIVLMNRGKPDARTRDFAQGIPLFNVKYRPAYLYNLGRNTVGHYNYLRGKRVLAFSGLGDNESFFGLLREIGARVVHTIEYPDHYAYRQGDMERIASVGGVDVIVTTEKDAIKIAFMDIPESLHYLAIDVHIDREKELLDMILKKVNSGWRRPGVAIDIKSAAG
jgi:tetraacyldisaccharide 4'-kinase